MYVLKIWNVYTCIINKYKFSMHWILKLLIFFLNRNIKQVIIPSYGLEKLTPSKTMSTGVARQSRYWMWGWNIPNNTNIISSHVNFIILYEWFHNKISSTSSSLETKEFDLPCLGLTRAALSMVSFNPSK